MSFAKRNGFARMSDLDDPELIALRERCFDAKEAFEGESRLDWSRQWEYPFVLANLPPAGDSARVLDAGSGWRFFGPMLARDGYRVDACDLDPSIEAKTSELAKREGLPLRFQCENLEALSYPDASFDCIACVSVLEHTPHPERVALEFARCLKPSGSLLLTFDVSLDGDRDISVAQTIELVGLIERHFELETSFADHALLDEAALAADDELLRTERYRTSAPELLPWRWVSRATLQSLARGRIGRPFFDLAVVGLRALRKHD